MAMCTTYQLLYYSPLGVLEVNSVSKQKVSSTLFTTGLKGGVTDLLLSLSQVMVEKNGCRLSSSIPVAPAPNITTVIKVNIAYATLVMGANKRARTSVLFEA